MADYDIKFEDNRANVLRAIDDAMGKFLLEVGAEFVSQTARNTRVDTGQLKNSWAAKVNEAEAEVIWGSPLENAIWEEFGTGEFAKETGHTGRQTPWRYQDRKGNWHTTTGKRPSRAMHNARKKVEPKVLQHARIVFGRLDE